MSKLLVVDDDEMMRECVATILSAHGYEVVEAKDGLEALLVFQTLRDEIPLIIMDVMMPRMDGIAATAAIKESDPFVKILLMSGHSENDPAQTKADAFLPKPFLSKELLAMIDKLLQEERPMHRAAG